jgi:hypothetical protein
LTADMPRMVDMMPISQAMAPMKRVVVELP